MYHDYRALILHQFPDFFHPIYGDDKIDVCNIEKMLYRESKDLGQTV